MLYFIHYYILKKKREKNIYYSDSLNFSSIEKEEIKTIFIAKINDNFNYSEKILTEVEKVEFSIYIIDYSLKVQKNQLFLDKT